MNSPFFQGVLFGIIIMVVFGMGCYVASPQLRRAVKSMLRKRDDDFGDEDDDDDE